LHTYMSSKIVLRSRVAQHIVWTGLSQILKGIQRVLRAGFDRFQWSSSTATPIDLLTIGILIWIHFRKAWFILCMSQLAYKDASIELLVKQNYNMAVP
jgi:hypothetical protein